MGLFQLDNEARKTSVQREKRIADVAKYNVIKAIMKKYCTYTLSKVKANELEEVNDGFMFLAET